MTKLNQSHIKLFLLCTLIIACSACVSARRTARSRSAPISEVVVCRTIRDIEPLIENADKDTLVLLDVDDTLIMPTHEFSFTHPIRKKWVQESKIRLSKAQRDFLISKIWMNRKVTLVENRTLEMLELISKKNIPAFALTAMYTGQFGAIDRVEDWRIDELLSMGMDFFRLSSNSAYLSFPDLKTERGVPMLKAGVIFTALRDKAEVFFEAKKALALKPSTIIFIDDDQNYVHAMQKLCKELDINFYGFIYTAAKSVPDPPLDQSLEKKRFDHLEKYGEWISDDSDLK